MIIVLDSFWCSGYSSYFMVLIHQVRIYRWLFAFCSVWGIESRMNRDAVITVIIDEANYRGESFFLVASLSKRAIVTRWRQGEVTGQQNSGRWGFAPSVASLWGWAPNCWVRDPFGLTPGWLWSSSGFGVRRWGFVVDSNGCGDFFLDW